MRIIYPISILVTLETPSLMENKYIVETACMFLKDISLILVTIARVEEEECVSRQR